MNRRSFFKRTLGFVGGVVAAFVPGKKKVTWAKPIKGIQRRKGTTYPTEPKKRSGTRPATKEEKLAYCSEHYCWDGCLFWKQSRCTQFTGSDYRIVEMKGCYIDGHGTLHMEPGGSLKTMTRLT